MASNDQGASRAYVRVGGQVEDAVRQAAPGLLVCQGWKGDHFHSVKCIVLLDSGTSLNETSHTITSPIPGCLQPRPRSETTPSNCKAIGTPVSLGSFA